MGCVSGKPPAQATDNTPTPKPVDEYHKLLLLGAGESGKSTLFKQMIEIYGEGFSVEDRKNFTPVVHNNIICAMQRLIQCSDLLEEETPTKIAEERAASKQFVDELDEEAPITPEVANHIRVLWEDPGVKNTYSFRSLYQLIDSAEYYFDRLDTISQSDYIPTSQDVLRTRVRTTGIVETKFEVDGVKFKMCDVGGQKSERRKWVQVFEGVKAVLFVAAISEYDQVLYEDEETNRVTEALDLFEEICNSRWFRDSAMVLFLNKKDLFEQKIQEVPLRECFDDFNGPDNDFQAALGFIKKKFADRCHDPNRDVHTHITCACDSEVVKEVFDSVKDIAAGIIRDHVAQIM